MKLGGFSQGVLFFETLENFVRIDEIYWKDKSTRLCKFLVDMQNYGGNSM